MKSPSPLPLGKSYKNLFVRLLFPCLFLLSYPALAHEGTTAPDHLLGNNDDITVSGKVIDQNGQPIPGVTISVPGSGIGTATDIDGNYTLFVPNGSTLVFSFIGFQSQTIEVGSRTVINVTMIEDMAS